MGLHRGLPLALLLAAAAAHARPPEPRDAQDFAEPPFAETGSTATGFTVHRYADRPQGALRLFVFPAEGAVEAERPRAAILLFHSGGWTRGRPEWLFGLARRFSQEGLVAVPVQYRLSRDGVTPVDALADACAAFRWVRAHAEALGVDPRRLAGWGASAGGQLAAATATAGCPDDDGAVSGAADALLLVSGGTDTARSGQFRSLVGEGVDAARYSPVAHVKAGVPPVLLIAGAEDSVTPVSDADAFCGKVRDAGSLCVLKTWPGLGHLLSRRLDDQRVSVDPDPAAEREAWAEQAQFLRRIGFISAGD